MSNIKTFRNSGYDCYNFIDDIVVENGLSDEAYKYVKLVFDYVDSDYVSETEEFGLLVNSESVYKCLFYLSSKEINLMNNLEIIQFLSKILVEQNQIDGIITLTDKQIDKVREAGFDLTYMNEYDLVILRSQMKEISQAFENLMKLTKNSDYKIIYDYITCLKLDNGEMAITNRQFLTAEIAKIDKLERVMVFAKNKKINELPNAKADLKNIYILPPGYLKGLPTGITIDFILKMLNRSKTVASYYLTKLS